MTPSQRHALLATGAIVPAVVYELVEVRQGPDGWPYSRYLRLLPPAAFVGCVTVFNIWFVPHIWRRVGGSS